MNLKKDNDFFKGFLQENNKKLSEKKESVTLFFSFDLVNSSRYKMYSCNWLYCIKKALYAIEEMVRNKISNSRLWRCIGDELIFTVNVISEEDLCKTIQIIYEILYDLNNSVKNAEIFCENKNTTGLQNDDSDLKKERAIKERFSLEKLILGVKATSWIAIIKQQNQSQDGESLGNNLDDNIEYTFITGQENAPGLQEFQGKDIDTGFRISKHNSCERRLALSLELAYILSKHDGVARKLHIISYQKLKGVFNSRLYPVIWYHDEYISGCSLEESFYYDEDEHNEIIADYFLEHKSHKIRFKEKKNTKDQLKKIVKDINLESKIHVIIDKMKDTKKVREVEASSLLEIHCVAVCYCQSKNSVLIFRRHDTDENYPKKWDFGCRKMTSGKSFKDQLREEYKRLVDLDIEILEPFKEFSIIRNEVIIPGIRFFALIKEQTIDKITIKDNEKYKECRLVELDEFIRTFGEKLIDKDEFIECINMVKMRFLNMTAGES